MKRTHEELIQLQELPLEDKVRMTKMRIQQWYLAFESKVYVSFSGGKDSTVLLHIARSMYPDIPAVFVDTGLEYPEIREFVKSVSGVTIVRPEIGFKQVLEKYGYPVISKEVADTVMYAQKGSEWALKKLCGEGKNDAANKFRQRFEKWAYLKDAPFKVSAKCCQIMKKSPAHKYERISGNHPILATMADESQMRYAAWLEHGCNAFGAARPISQPMSFWTENDVLEYLKVNDVPYCPIYGEIVEDDGEFRTTGADRTGCMFCMFGVQREKHPNRFERMRTTHPKLYDYCMRPIGEGGLGLNEVLNYIAEGGRT